MRRCATATDSRGRKLTAFACGASIRVFEDYQRVENGAELRSRLTGHTGPVSSVAFSSDGTMMASGSHDKSIKLWNVADGTLLRSMDNAHTHSVNSVTFSPDGTTMASGSVDYSIKLWNVADGTLVRSMDNAHTGSVISVTFSPDGTTMASGSDDKSIKLWNVADGTLVRSMDNAHTEWVTSISFSPDGTMMASGSDDESIKLWKVADGTLLRSIDNAHTNWVSSVTFSPDGTMMASGSHDKSIKLWNVADGTLVRSMDNAHTNWVISVTFSPDGTMMASGSVDYSIKLWNVADGTLLRSIDNAHTNSVFAVTFSPDGTMMASGGGDKSIKLWNVADGTSVRSMDNCSTGTHSLCFSDDCRLIAACSDTVLSVHAVLTGAPLVELSGKQLRGPLKFEQRLPSEMYTLSFMEGSVERTLRLDGSLDVRAAMSKAASLRSFIKDYAGNPSKLLADRCVKMGDALLAANTEQHILNRTESTLYKARRQLEACGVTSELLASLATPDEACRGCLQEEETLQSVDEAHGALKEVSQQPSNVPAASLAECPVPPYLKAFHEKATTTIAAALNNAEQVLATFDDPATHEDDGLAGDALFSVLEVHASLVQRTSQLFNDLRKDLPADAINAHKAEVDAQAKQISDTLNSLTAQLDDFKETAAAFKAAVTVLGATKDEAAAKVEEVHALAAEIQDKQADCEIIAAQLKRPRLTDAKCQQLQAEMATKKEEVGTLRTEYRQRHKKILKAVLRFFPELQSELIDPNNFVTTIQQYDATMTMDSFDEVRRDGTVHRAVLNSKAVVIKHFAQTQVDHFKRECRVYSSVQHPFVGELVAAFSDDDGLHTVMPRYGGGTADAWMGMHCDDAFPTMRVLRQAADGLKCLHLGGVCHCDFKPLNIVMTSAAHHGTPKLIDFGCADVKETATVLLNRAHTQTMKSLAGFTPQYVAPEVAQKLEESMSNYSPTAAQAESFATVVTPALDVYAFGRWMSEVLQCPATFEKEFALPVGEDGALTCPMLDALQPFKSELDALANQCLLKDPSQRPSAADVARRLHQVEEQLQESHDAGHAEENEVLECCTCFCDVKRKDAVTCHVTVRGAAHPMHTYCRQCLDVMLQDWRHKPVANHVEAGGKVTCSFGNCSGLLDEQAILAIAPDALDAIKHVQKTTAEFIAVEETKRRIANESLEQRAIREVDENILGVRCPKCKALSTIDFSECLAMTCPQCGTNFCGYCMADCGDDAHAHVTANHPSDDGLGLFTTRARWYHYFYHRQEEALNQYLATLPAEVAAKVREVFPRPQQ